MRSGVQTEDLHHLRSIADVEDAAQDILGRPLFDYMFGEPSDSRWGTYANNIRGFDELVLRPRVLVNVSERQFHTTVLGTPVQAPVIIGPAGSQYLMHPDAEVASARAAADAGTIFVCPASPSVSLQDLSVRSPGPKWYQCFIYTDRAITRHLVEAAEQADFRGIVVTVSNAGLGGAGSARRMPPDVPRPEGPAPALLNFDWAGSPRTLGELNKLIDDSITWKDIEWLRSITSLPVVVKGVQTSEDATLAVGAGVDAIVVSNHGGRFLQGARATIEALPEVAAVVGDRAEIYLDGGVRDGSDIVKALGLGARAVLVGRPVFWGLAVGGQMGVRRVLEILVTELAETLGLCGIRAVDDLTAAVVTLRSSGFDASVRKMP